jgi:hypothetical protein
MNKKKLQKYCKNADMLSICKDLRDEKLSNDDLKYIFEYSCVIGALNIIEYFVNNCLINLQDDFMNYFNKACINENLEIVQYLLKLNENFDINFKDGFIIRTLIERHKYNMAKYLMEKFKGAYYVHISNESILRLVVQYENVEFLKYLLQYSKYFNTSAKSHYVYSMCCRINNVEMINLLLNYDKNNKIIFNESAYYHIFQNAFRCNNIELAKDIYNYAKESDVNWESRFLYNVVMTFTHYYFRMAVFNNKIDFINLLCSMYSGYSLIYDQNNNIIDYKIEKYKFIDNILNQQLIEIDLLNNVYQFEDSHRNIEYEYYNLMVDSNSEYLLDVLQMKNVAKETTFSYNSDCCICYENVTNQYNIVMPCNHSLCYECFMNWYIKDYKRYIIDKRECLVCKQNFEFEQCVYY